MQEMLETEESAGHGGFFWRTELSLTVQNKQGTFNPITIHGKINTIRDADKWFLGSITAYRECILAPFVVWKQGCAKVLDHN